MGLLPFERVSFVSFKFLTLAKSLEPFSKKSELSPYFSIFLVMLLVTTYYGHLTSYAKLEEVMTQKTSKGAVWARFAQNLADSFYVKNPAP